MYSVRKSYILHVTYGWCRKYTYVFFINVKVGLRHFDLRISHKVNRTMTKCNAHAMTMTMTTYNDNKIISES